MNNKVKVAVLDTGIDKEHDYLKDNLVGGIAFECMHDYIFISEYQINLMMKMVMELLVHQ